MREHAEQLGCPGVLDGVRDLARERGSERQRSAASAGGLPGLMQRLIERFSGG